MTPVAIYIGVALGLMIGGLLVCYLSASAGRAATVFWWLGIVCAVCGALLLLAKIVVWLATQLSNAIGVNG